MAQFKHNVYYVISTKDYSAVVIAADSLETMLEQMHKTYFDHIKPERVVADDSSKEIVIDKKDSYEYTGFKYYIAPYYVCDTPSVKENKAK